MDWWVRWMSLGDRGGGMSWKFTSFISPSEILPELNQQTQQKPVNLPRALTPTTSQN